MEKLIKWTLLVITIIGLAVCLPIYITQLEPVTSPVDNSAPNAVAITSLKIHLGSDESETTVYSVDIICAPTENTWPDQSYNVVVSYNATTVHFDVSWNQKELDASQPKSLSSSLTAEQYLAIINEGAYSVTVNDIKPKHDFFLLLPWIVTLALFLGLTIYRMVNPRKLIKKQRRPHNLSFKT
jgi:hypothetical protein